ncbi:hypothetical protein AGMMS49521_2180 [Campylobacterota bacterium]|nr:hypothetical protein AGMMS49521_2180 [Campylobacterota bacterium]
MAGEQIAFAIQDGNYVKVKDPQGNLISDTYISGGQLMGFTASTFSVRNGNYIKVYDAKGNILSDNYAPS